MKHLIISREYPPAPYPAGGIGTYVRHIARLLAENGQIVHVIGQRWEGARREIEESCGGRLVVHRIAADDAGLDSDPPAPPGVAARELQGLLDSSFPAQWFSWRAGRLAEELIEEEGIDLIEGQEWEAPLYYLQLRRALGRGPRRHPPCLVHFHSPTELIFRHNEWDPGRPDYLPTKRQEDYTIGAADAHLAPSRFLARQCEEHYGLPPGSIATIPLPMGDSSMLERTEETWERGTICYVGRLEPRKGVVEWVTAAVAVAREHREAVFDFVGADLPYTDRVSVRELLEREIPAELRARFRFHGAQERSRLPALLRLARVAVVPSRWENFPNTCMEAMASGLPVIASRQGGMAEMIEDGRSGWLTPAEGVAGAAEGLAAALSRALAASPREKAAMGQEAASAIRRLCDNAVVVRRHVELRERVVRQGAERSLLLPAVLTPAGHSRHERVGDKTAGSGPGGEGLAVIVTGLDHAGGLDECLESVGNQTARPVAGVVIVGDWTDEGTRRVDEWAREAGWDVVSHPRGTAASAKNAGIEAVRRRGISPAGWVFLEARVRLQPGSLAVYAATLRHCPDVGLVSSWVDNGAHQVHVSPCPAFPYQWLSNEVASASAIRVEALAEVGGFSPGLGAGYEDWDLANTVLAAGWKAVTYPAILSSQPAADRSAEPAGTWMRRALLDRFPDLLGRRAGDLVLLLEARLRSGTTPPRRQEGPLDPAGLLRRPFGEQLGLLALAARNPRRAVQWLFWHATRTMRRAADGLRGAVGERDR